MASAIPGLIAMILSISSDKDISGSAGWMDVTIAIVNAAACDESVSFIILSVLGMIRLDQERRLFEFREGLMTLAGHSARSPGPTP